MELELSGWSIQFFAEHSNLGWKFKRLLGGKFKLQTRTFPTRDTSMSADPQETGCGVLRHHVGSAKLECYRVLVPSRFKGKKTSQDIFFRIKRLNDKTIYKREHVRRPSVGRFLASFTKYARQRGMY